MSAPLLHERRQQRAKHPLTQSPLPHDFLPSLTASCTGDDEKLTSPSPTSSGATPQIRTWQVKTLLFRLRECDVCAELVGILPDRRIRGLL